MESIGFVGLPACEQYFYFVKSFRPIKIVFYLSGVRRVPFWSHATANKYMHCHQCNIPNTIQSLAELASNQLFMIF